jgi:NitT/TauT family transport system substrate-binding protein
MLNWYPEAEHGGFYAAKVHGLFEKYGLDVDIRAGGPSSPVAQELLTGRVQFAVGNADDVLLFRQEDADIVALLAPIQDTPRCIMVHESSPVKDLHGLAGLTLQANVGRPFLNFLEFRGLLKDVKVVPFSGSVSNFVADKNMAIQAYSFSEPLLAKQQGAASRSLMVSDVGFNPYASCLIATRDYIGKNRELSGRMVAACREGWLKYFQSPQETNELILKLNSQGMTADALEFGTQTLKPLCFPSGMTEQQFGQMTKQRWQDLCQQFVDIKLGQPAAMQAEKAFDDSFLKASE